MGTDGANAARLGEMAIGTELALTKDEQLLRVGR